MRIVSATERIALKSLEGDSIDPGLGREFLRNIPEQSHRIARFSINLGMNIFSKNSSFRCYVLSDNLPPENYKNSIGQVVTKKGKILISLMITSSVE